MPNALNFCILLLQLGLVVVLQLVNTSLQTFVFLSKLNQCLFQLRFFGIALLFEFVNCVLRVSVNICNDLVELVLSYILAFFI